MLWGEEQARPVENSQSSLGHLLAPRDQGVGAAWLESIPPQRERPAALSQRLRAVHQRRQKARLVVLGRSIAWAVGLAVVAGITVSALVGLR